MSRRHRIGLAAAGLLAAVSLVASGCAASGPTPLPTLSSPVPSPSAALTATGSPTGVVSPPSSALAPATPTLSAGPDAWAAYAAAWRGCTNTSSGPLLIRSSDAVPQGVVPIGACAVVFYGPEDGAAWIASPTGLSRFADNPVRPIPGMEPEGVSLAVDPNGIWVADTSIPFRPALSFIRPTGIMSVQLPPRTINIEAIQRSGASLLVAIDSGDRNDVTSDIGSPSAGLLSVAQDGTVTPLWSAPDAVIQGIATDGTTTALAVGQLGYVGVSVAVGDGTHWAKTEVTADQRVFAFGIAVDGDMIVVTSQRTDDQVRAPVAAVTSISRDRGATWTSTETPYEGAGTLLGFHGGTALGDGMSEDLNQAGQRLVQLTDAGEWVPFEAFAALPPGGRTPFLVECGLWSIERTVGGDDTILRYTPLPGPGC